MLSLRPLAVGDLDDLVALAGQLDSANLPQDASFRATLVRLGPEGEPIVSVECREALGVSSGDRVSITPLP